MRTAWWPQVALVRFFRAPVRVDRLAVEKAVIGILLPTYNVVATGRHSERTFIWRDEYRVQRQALGDVGYVDQMRERHGLEREAADQRFRSNSAAYAAGRRPIEVA